MAKAKVGRDPTDYTKPPANMAEVLGIEPVWAGVPVIKSEKDSWVYKPDQKMVGLSPADKAIVDHIYAAVEPITKDNSIEATVHYTGWTEDENVPMMELFEAYNTRWLSTLIKHRKKVTLKDADRTERLHKGKLVPGIMDCGNSEDSLWRLFKTTLNVKYQDDQYRAEIISGMQKLRKSGYMLALNRRYGNTRSVYGDSLKHVMTYEERRHHLRCHYANNGALITTVQMLCSKGLVRNLEYESMLREADEMMVHIYGRRKDDKAKKKKKLTRNEKLNNPFKVKTPGYNQVIASSKQKKQAAVAAEQSKQKLKQKE